MVTAQGLVYLIYVYPLAKSLVFLCFCYLFVLGENSSLNYFYLLKYHLFLLGENSSLCLNKSCIMNLLVEPSMFGGKPACFCGFVLLVNPSICSYLINHH